MKSIQRFVAVALLGVGALFSLPVLATTYYCDNDRSKEQYPHCNTHQDFGWVYYANGDGKDWNGDDRRFQYNSSGFGSYHWDFLTFQNYQFQVWLANSAFNDPKAEYVGQNSTLDKVLNQNTAAYGWNKLPVANERELVLIPSDVRGYTTGADMARVITTTSSAHEATDADDMVDTTASCSRTALATEPDVAAIQRKMLSAATRYHDISGKFHIWFANNGQSDDVDFKISEVGKRSVINSSDATGTVIHRIVGDGLALTMYPQNSAYRQNKIDQSVPVETSDTRFYRDGLCRPVYVHSSDPAKTAFADEVTSPENYAFWLTTSPAKVIGHASLLGRMVTIIEGHPDAYLTQKLGATNFKMWVDDSTGILMQLVGTDAKGNRVYFIDVSQIAIDQGMNLPAFSTPIPANWKRIAN